MITTVILTLAIGGILALVVMEILLARVVLEIIRQTNELPDETHYLCADCFERRDRDLEPIRYMNQSAYPCCVCSLSTTDGVWFTPRIAELNCEGRGVAHERERAS